MILATTDVLQIICLNLNFNFRVFDSILTMLMSNDAYAVSASLVRPIPRVSFEFYPQRPMALQIFNAIQKQGSLAHLPFYHYSHIGCRSAHIYYTRARSCLLAHGASPGDWTQITGVLCPGKKEKAGGTDVESVTLHTRTGGHQTHFDERNSIDIPSALVSIANTGRMQAGDRRVWVILQEH